MFGLFKATVIMTVYKCLNIIKEKLMNNFGICNDCIFISQNLGEISMKTSKFSIF